MNSLVTGLLVGVCSVWSQPQTVGKLDHQVINEASGLAAVGSDLYHINDSGNSAVIYKTDLQGRLKASIQVKGEKVQDWEELQLGPCGSEKCLYIGDIGDNKRKRKDITLIAIRLSDLAHAKKVTPLFRLTLHYPDRAHNAEAFVIDTDGNIFLFTKVKSPFEMAGEATSVFRLSARDYNVEEFQQFAELKLWSSYPLANVITGAALSPDGKRLAILTYSSLIENAFDSNNPGLMDAPTDYSQASVTQLPQPEALTYLGNSDLLVSSETFENFDPPLFKYSCLK